nr:unnamed protein product [Callosobruchus chinensis]
MYKLKEPDTAKKFRDDVEEKISYIYDNAGDWNVEKTWQTLKKNLLDAAKKVCGVMKVNKNIKQTAWWTAEIKQEVKKKKKKWREFLQKKSVEAYNDYKRQRKKVKDLVSKAKAKSWEDFGNQMEENSQGNQKLFYNILNKIRDKKPLRSSAVKDKQGNTLTDLKDMEMRWKEYFHELLCTEDPEKPVKQQIGNIDSDPETIEMYELLEAIQKIKVGKAAGHDNIKPEIIKALGPKGRTMLLSLYLKVWESGVVPKDWEVGVIIPIFKKGDPKDCGNYRGITLLSTVVKTFERILERKLYSKVEHELLDSQSGFRKGFSTQDHTFTIKQIISKTLEQNKEAYIAYLDLEKAFDRVERNKVWEILTRRKVGGKLIRAIQGLYQVNRNYVRVNGIETEEFTTEQGLRQGSVLSPILFIIVLDEAMKETRQTTRRLQVGYRNLLPVEISECSFADDLAIFANTESDLQRNLNIWNNILKQFNMKVNVDKSKIMTVSRYHAATNISIDGKKLEDVDTFKYLGTVIDSTGREDQNLGERISGAGKLFWALNRSCFSKRELSIKTKLKVYKTLVLPVLLWGSESWVLSKRMKQQLQTMEMKFLRRIKAFFRTDIVLTRNSPTQNDLVDLLIHPVNRKFLTYYQTYEPQPEMYKTYKCMCDEEERRRKECEENPSCIPRTH